MWLWHAVEEAEHKAVCFDVYQQVAGKGAISYLNRVGAMLYATWIFAIGAHRAVRMLRTGEKDATQDASTDRAADAAPRKPKRGTLQVLREIVPLRMYLQYFRPGFHPWDIDDSDLIAEWKRRYKDFGAIADVPGEAHA
jgi:predicted metal-dependent hydrolase